MRTLKYAVCVAISLSAYQVQAKAPVEYKVRDSKATDDVSIQTVSIDTAFGMDRKSISNVNAALTAVSADFDKEAKQCRASAQGHPWEYASAVEKVLLSEKYLSVVFSKWAACAGSPIIQKEARVFSLQTGKLIPSRSLFKQLLPSAKIVTGISTNKELIRLDETMAETMIKDSKGILKTHDDRCNFYLKTTSYRIWIDGKNLILFPDFVQPSSFCQKEYLIRVTN